MKKALRILPFVAAGLLAARFLRVVSIMAGALPEGPWPVVRFLLVALVVCLAPGLALLRFSRVRLSLLETAVFVPATSLAATGFVSWTLYFCGICTRGATLAMLAAFAAAGAWGAAPRLRRASLRAAVLRLRAVPARAWIAPLAAALFLEGLFEATLGEPFQGWDAVVTWDKWAFDMGARAGLGLQLLGGYPQMLPAISSVFYKAAAVSPDTALPVEQLLLHGFAAVYPALIALSLLSLGRRCGFPAILALGLLVACDPLKSDLAAGQADVPVAAFAAALAALLPPLSSRGGRRAFAPLALLFFATVFTKGAGVVFSAALAASVAVRDRGRPLRLAAAAFAAAVAFAAPYLAHQLWIDAHPALRESSPLLVSLPFHAAHVRLFTPDLEHLRTMARVLVGHRCASPLAPPAAALAVLGAGLLAALARRRTRAAALALAALLAFWFFTASYDWRNAYPTLVLGAGILAAAAAPLPLRASGVRKGRSARAAALAAGAIFLALVATAGAGLVRSGAWTTLKRPVVRSWKAPKTVRLAPERRHMASRNAGRLRNILLAAPWAARAEHVWTGSPRYRLLAPKGCYTPQLNSWLHAHPGDLFVESFANAKPPKGFVRIAELRHLGDFGTLWMFRPDLAPGLVLEIPAPAGDARPTRDLFGDAAAGDRFAPYVAPVRDGDVLRLPNPAADVR